MAEKVISTGVDALVSNNAPSKNYLGQRYTYVRSGTYRTLLAMPAMQPVGTVVVSATLSGVAAEALIAQDIHVTALAAPWKASTVTWANQPATVGTAVVTSIPATAAGARFSLDVTALVQQVTLQRYGYGWRVSSAQATQNSKLNGFLSGASSWQLTIVTSDATTPPSTLTPAGVISKNKWVAQIDEVDEIAAMQVQVDPAANPATAWDSGEVATTVPQIDLAATSYPGLADGAATSWRARAKVLGGSWSGWSDWVDVTRVAKPTLTTSTTAIKDPTPVITASLTPAGTADTRWQVIITEAANPSVKLYDSGDDLEGATLSHEIPFKWNGRVVFPVDGTYRRVIRAWDRPDRVTSYGDPSYVESVQTITLDTDADGNPPDTLTVTQVAPGHPDVRLRWTQDAATAPTKFLVFREGVRVAELTNPAALLVAADTWEWVDKVAPPNVELTYLVRAVYTTGQSIDSPPASIFTKVTGVWLRAEPGDVLLYGTDIGDWKQADKRVTHVLPYRAEDVDIVTAVGWHEGTYTGVIDNRGEQDVDAARVILEHMRQEPSLEVNLIAATLNIWVHLRALSVTPHPEILPGRQRQHTVSFGFFEIDPRD